MAKVYDYLCHGGTITKIASDQHVPNVTIMFDHFAKIAGIASPQQLADLDKPHGDPWKLFRDLWESWAKSPNYEQKKQIFKDQGFKVVGLFADLNKMSDFLDQSHLDDQFVAQQKNLLTIDVDNSSMYRDEQHVVFVLEYALNQDPLAAKTVDYDEIRNELKMRHDLDKVFNHKDHETIVDEFMKNYKKINLKGVVVMFAIRQIVKTKKYGRKHPYFHFNPKEHDVIYIMQKEINQSIIKDLLVKSRSFFSITLQQTSVVNYK